MQQRTFEEVRESLRGKVILVANRSIPASPHQPLDSRAI